MQQWQCSYISFDLFEKKKKEASGSTILVNYVCMYKGIYVIWWILLLENVKPTHFPKKQKLNFAKTQHISFTKLKEEVVRSCCSILLIIFSKRTNTSCCLFSVSYVITNNTAETFCVRAQNCCPSPALHLAITKPLNHPGSFCVMNNGCWLSITH